MFLPVIVIFINSVSTILYISILFCFAYFRSKFWNKNSFYKFAFHLGISDCLQQILYIYIQLCSYNTDEFCPNLPGAMNRVLASIEWLAAYQSAQMFLLIAFNRFAAIVLYQHFAAIFLHNHMLVPLYICAAYLLSFLFGLYPVITGIQRGPGGFQFTMGNYRKVLTHE